MASTGLVRVPSASRLNSSNQVPLSHNGLLISNEEHDRAFFRVSSQKQLLHIGQ
jgi:hypothetical protein